MAVDRIPATQGGTSNLTFAPILIAVAMRVLSIILSLGALTQGVLAQQEFLERLPSCAVSFPTSS